MTQAMKIQQALKGLVAPMDLSAEQQEEYFDRLDQIYSEPSQIANAFFEDRRRRGVGVGMDDVGNIVNEIPRDPDA